MSDFRLCAESGQHRPTQRHSKSECPERGIDDRLRTTYATAMRHAHEGGRVELHLGSNIIEYLRSLCTVPAPLALGRTAWGFPVMEAPAAQPDHISVHVVETIQ